MAKKTTSPSSFDALWLVMSLLLLGGIVLSILLTHLHVKVHLDPLHQSACAINAKVNCDTVARSRYSIFLNVPVSVWGLGGYLLLLLTLLLGWKKERRSPALLGIFFVLILVSALSSLRMAYTSYRYVDSYCLYCIGTYLINLILLPLAWLALRQRQTKLGEALNASLQWMMLNLSYLFLLIFAAAILILAYPRYWESPTPSPPPQSAKGSSSLLYGLDQKGHPWIGSAVPQITLTLFSDYQCPFCVRSNRNLRELLVEAADTVRVTHRHYPLDHTCNPAIKEPFHTKACLFARAAYCAGQQGHFWTTNDLLYTESRSLSEADLPQRLAQLGVDAASFSTCLHSDEAKRAIASDLEAGNQRQIQGTPTFLAQGTDHNLPQGTDEKGHPWIGARETSLVIEEYSDYQCPFCKRAHQKVRDLIRKYPSRLRLVHRNFPLDKACNPLVKKDFHPRACLLAKAAHCAGKQDRFWIMNDLLYATQAKMDREKLSKWVFYLGLDTKAFKVCLDSEDTEKRLQDDIREGSERHKQQGTPFFAFQGKLYLGSIPPAVLDAALAPTPPQTPLVPKTPVQPMPKTPVQPTPKTPVQLMPKTPVQPTPKTPVQRSPTTLPLAPTSRPNP